MSTKQIIGQLDLATNLKNEALTSAAAEGFISEAEAREFANLPISEIRGQILERIDRADLTAPDNLEPKKSNPHASLMSHLSLLEQSEVITLFLGSDPEFRKKLSATLADPNQAEQFNRTAHAILAKLAFELKFTSQWDSLPDKFKEGRRFKDIVKTIPEEDIDRFEDALKKLTKPTILGVKEGKLLIADGEIVGKEQNYDQAIANANQDGFGIFTYEEACDHHKIDRTEGYIWVESTENTNKAHAVYYDEDGGQRLSIRVSKNRTDCDPNLGYRRVYRVPLNFES